ncbi:MAG: potassium-transporting ATPase subunit C, partial [Planctomyces sp.]|nr:potassium-transporting ATPase subunit C [Planctomyces sp.]
MLAQLRTAILLMITLTILTGGVYPLVVTAVAQVVFPT